MTYAVWYASAGCIPDSDYPEFIGSLQECEEFVAENAADYQRPEVQHDLYGLSIDTYDAADDDLLV